MRRCQEVLARVGVHGASLTATVSRIAEILPVEQAHINSRILVQDTSVSTDLAIHPSLRTACDMALRHSAKAYAQALHSRISALERCEPDPSIQNEDPANKPTLLTPDSPLGARFSSIRTPSFPPSPQVHKPFKPKRLRRPPPSLPSVPAIRVVSFNTAKSQNTPAAILHFLNEGYDVILLQELNSPPLLPQRYAFSNDRAKVFSNVCGYRHGVSVIAGPRIARYTSCVPPRDSDGLICGAKISLPEATPLHVFSLYSPPVRTGAPAPYRDTIQRVLASFFNDHPNHILGGDFNCVLDPALDQHSLVHLHEWHWLTGEVEYLPSRLVDTFRSEHPSLRQYTRYASDRWDSEARLDYIFASPRLVSHFPLLDASVLMDYTISDHHPVVAVFQCPSPILLRAGSRAGQRSARPGAPPPAVPQRRGRMVQSTTTPPVPRAVRRCGPPESSAQGARPRASCSRGAAGSMSMTGRRRVQSEHSPGGLSVRLPWPPCRGLEHQASHNPPHAPPPPPDAPPPQAARARWWRTLVHTRRPHEQPGRHYKRRHGRTKPQRGKPETLERHRRQRAGPGAAQPCDPSCPASATSMHAPPSCPARATHTGTAASPSRVCHHGVRGRSTVRQALGPDNRDSPSPVVSAQRRVLTMGQGVRHRP